MTNLNGHTMTHADKATAFHDLQQQCLRILRCTASALASTPGGLRFKAGTRPWLEGVSGGRPAKALPPATGAGRSFSPA